VKVRTLLAALLAVCVCGALFVGSARANRVNVRVVLVSDEEYRDHAQSIIGHFMDWKTLSDFQMTLSQCIFDSNYIIKLYVWDWKVWYSPPTTNMTQLMEWAASDLGFVPGQGRDIMVIFTGQECTTAGKSWRGRGIVIVFDGWKYWWQGYDYAVDNIICHEISHLYWAADHYQYQEGYNYCIMSNGDAGLTSTVWCTACHDTIMSNRTLYGIEPIGGGGGGYGGSGRFVLGDTWDLP